MFSNIKGYMFNISLVFGCSPICLNHFGKICDAGLQLEEEQNGQSERYHEQQSDDGT
jgi:hypothetical protein